MKGIEGLALKYIVIILVAALVIGVAFSVATTFTGMAARGAFDLNQTLDTITSNQTGQTCEMMGCAWDAVARQCTC